MPSIYENVSSTLWSGSNRNPPLNQKSLFKVASIPMFSSWLVCYCKSICKYTSKFRKCGNASKVL